MAVFPASHYVVPQEKINEACVAIEREMEERVRWFKSRDKLLEAQRIAERTNFDICAKRDFAAELKIIPGILPECPRGLRRIH